MISAPSVILLCSGLWWNGHHQPFEAEQELGQLLTDEFDDAVNALTATLEMVRKLRWAHAIRTERAAIGRPVPNQRWK